MISIVIHKCILIKMELFQKLVVEIILQQTKGTRENYGDNAVYGLIEGDGND